MRKTALILLIIAVHTVWGMLLFDQPVTVEQPDGTVLELLASGDEFYNYLHDEDGFTIVQNPRTGYFVYAENIRGKLSAGNMVVG